MKAKRLNNLFYRVTVDENGEIMSVESAKSESKDFVRLNEKHLEALERPVCTKTMLESHGKVKTITGERRNNDANIQ